MTVQPSLNTQARMTRSGNCRKLLDSCTVTTHEDDLYCKYCYFRLFPPSRSSFRVQPAESDSIPSLSTNTSLSYSTENDYSCKESIINSQQKPRLRGGGKEEKKIFPSRQSSSYCREGVCRLIIRREDAEERKNDDNERSNLAYERPEDSLVPWQEEDKFAGGKSRTEMNVSKENFPERDRMRGGCGSCEDRPSSCPGSDRSSRRGRSPCPSRESNRRVGCCPAADTAPICEKSQRCWPPCMGEKKNCGGGGCCGSGCRGGCGKPGQICMPTKPCTLPSCRSHPPATRGSPCCSPRSCATQQPCYKSFLPTCNSTASSRNNSGCCQNRGNNACQSKFSPGCGCFGGGLDCQRCGRKVYQAEMQIASGVPYHNICFSCFCCRKPLEALTYQENCGEIYCKQCYIRNFGPQGYGYGIGAGVLQTPM
ncbi:uncharacterized protein [Prorops nasuta]|uniref:uncharacterized protein isoform X2 n=1 Tax=Prorops nasuta TaxID=863751 RepID=UPI0034CF7E40